MSDFDYLFLEPLLIERIKAEVPGLVDVVGMATLTGVEESRKTSPKVYVVYLGDEIGTSSTPPVAGRVQPVNQLWGVVLEVFYADSTGDGFGARRAAGPLLGRLLTALSGWVPALDVSPLSRSAKQLPSDYSDGFFYYPLVFQARFVYPRIKTWPIN